MVATMMLLFLLLPLCVQGAIDDLRMECRREVQSCEPMRSPSVCLGASLPYTDTSSTLADDSSNVTEALTKLNLWTGLRNAPKCWEVVQPLLCSVYLPQCVEINNRSYISLPPKEFCDITRSPCGIVEMYGWPSFLNCSNEHFISGCSDTSAVKGLKFNTTGKCEPPLVATDNRNSWYKNVDGCGVQCQNPLFTEQEHHTMRIFIAVCGSLCMAATLFTVLTFAIDWKHSSRYPALIVFFINACFFIGSLGWMAQFVPGSREDIVCRKDGTMKTAEPQLSSGETLSCAVVFFVVYYFMIAGCIWFVILSYCWHLLFSNMRSPVKFIEAKRGTFHMFAWSLPLVLTIVCLALTQIDGDSMTGICFVGGVQHSYRAGFVLAPIALVIIVGLVFLISGLIKLVRMRVGSPGVISDKASATITATIIRLGVFAVLALLLVMLTFAIHLYIFTHEKQWAKSFEEYIFCEADVSDIMGGRKLCLIENRPSLVAMHLHVFAYFGTGLVMSFWVWNRATLRTWKKFLKKCWGLAEEEPEPMKVKKHKIIANAFSKRGELNQGRLSLSFQSMQDDPLGMRFDMNSVSSREVSSVWAAAIPRLIQRRGGLDQRRHSDSDVHSIQSVMDQISGIISDTESRRQSLHSLTSGDKQSHNSSGQEEKATVSQPQPTEQHAGKRRKRRKRNPNRKPINTISAEVASKSQTNTNRLGSLERVSSLGTGSDLQPQSNSLCTPDDAAQSDHSDSSAASIPKPSGVVNIAYEEMERSRTINRVFRIEASPTSAFSPYRSSEHINEDDTPVPSPRTLSIASSDTEAMSVKDYKPPAPIKEPKQKHTMPSIAPMQMPPNFPPIMYPHPYYPPMYSHPHHSHHPQSHAHPNTHPNPYTLPQHFTALHAHTTYSMLHGGGFNPDLLHTPFLPFGMPVPPVPIKRSKRHSPIKETLYCEEEPRLTQPKPMSHQAVKPKPPDMTQPQIMRPPIAHPIPVKPQPMTVFDIEDENGTQNPLMLSEWEEEETTA